MSKDMKLIMERWDRFVLLENETLEKIKDSETETKSLIQKISKTKDKQQLQNFLNIVSQDKEIMDLVRSFEKLEDIIEKEKIDEGLADSLLAKQQQLGVKAFEFFNTDTGKKINKYGPMTAAIAYIAFQLTRPGGEGLGDAANGAAQLLTKRTNITAEDVFGMVSGVDMATGNVAEQ